MDPQRIQALQRNLARRKEVPGVSLARKQGQAMTTNNKGGVNALRTGLTTRPDRRNERPAIPTGGRGGVAALRNTIRPNVNRRGQR